MEATFTGLKLKGDIGKFGVVELTDVASFAELPNGQTISGSESGFLLVWEGALLRAQFGRKGKKPSHDRNCECVMLDTFGKMVVSAGFDGCVRWWLRNDFEVEVTNPTIIQEIVLLKEICLGPSFPIHTLLPCEDHWIVQTDNGKICELSYSTDILTHHIELPSGRINAVALPGGTGGEYATPETTAIGAAVGCEDGKLFFLNAKKKRMSLCRKFDSAVTALAWCPEECDSSGKRILVGCADGTVKIVQMSVPAALPPVPEADLAAEAEEEGKWMEERERRRKKRVLAELAGEEEEGGTTAGGEEKKAEEGEKEAEGESASSEPSGAVSEKAIAALAALPPLVPRRVVRARTFAAPPLPTLSIQVAFKPHTQRITAISVSPLSLPDEGGTDVGVLVTGAEDATVFFFSLPSPIDIAGPIGFVRVVAAVAGIAWPDITPVGGKVAMVSGWEEEEKAGNEEEGEGEGAGKDEDANTEEPSLSVTILRTVSPQLSSASSPHPPPPSEVALHPPHPSELAPRPPLPSSGSSYSSPSLYPPLPPHLFTVNVYSLLLLYFLLPFPPLFMHHNSILSLPPFTQTNRQPHPLNTIPFPSPHIPPY
jgi:WD40 repeat protein